MQELQADKNDLDRVYDNYQLGDLLTAVYRGSDYRFGCLHFAEPMGEGNYPDHLVNPPEFMQSGWTEFHEIPMVLHPQKGALLLTSVWYTDEYPQASLGELIEEEHSQLTALEWKIRDQLECVGYWANRAIVLGVGLVAGQRVPEDERPANVPDVAIIDRDKLPQLATHIDALFEHYTTPAARPVDEWGDRLVADLTADNSFLGCFVDEEQHINTYESCGLELDGLVEPAA